jgi:polar amino acid transport system substrate-binding protein
MFCVRSLSLASIFALAAALPVPAQNPPAASLATPFTTMLAPTGTLRAAFLGDNPVLGRVDSTTGAVTGPVADLVQELARRLNVPFTLIPASGARDIIGRLQRNSADIGFMAYNAGRAADVDFSMPWLLMPNSYLVRADSPLQKVEDADRAGVNISAVKNDTQDVYLSGHLKNNQVNTVPAMPAPEEIQALLMGGKVDAFAANRQRLLEVAGRFPNLRVLPDDYYVAGQAIAVAKGDASHIQAVNALLDSILATPLVKTSIDKAGLHGVDAAKPSVH